MGFEVPVPVYALRFDSKTKWDGLVVRMESAPVGVLFDVARLSEGVQTTKGAEQFEQAERLLSAVASCLVSWNIVKHGEPVPATVEGLRAQPLDLVMEIISAWTTAVTEVPDPLVKPLPNGSTLADLPTQTLTPDPASL